MPTFATPQPITATLNVGGAQVRVVASDRTDTVVQVEPLNAASKKDVKVAEKTKVSFSAGQLKVDTKVVGDRLGSIAITIELPAGSGLVTGLWHSSVTADGALGDCELHMASGRVRLDRIAALRAELSAGEVEIGHVAGTATVNSSAASMRIGEVEGTVSYEGATGKVWIGHASADVDLSSARGGVDIDRAEGSVVAKAGNCPIRIGRITRGQADLSNGAGGIEVGIDEGTAAWVDAKSTKGSVRSSLPAQDNPREFDNVVRVHARTRLDDIVIHRAAG